MPRCAASRCPDPRTSSRPARAAFPQLQPTQRNNFKSQDSIAKQGSLAARNTAICMAVSASKVDLAPSPSGARSPPSPPPCRRICQLHAPTGVRYGTVRYAGPVEGTRGEWLGVEWDLDGRGKHDGLHAGRRYFECSRPGSDVASFIRPDGVGVGRGVSLIAALNEKYVGSTSAADATSLPSSSSAPAYSRRNLAEIEIEMPNMDKVSARVRVLANLKTVALVGPVERMASADRGEDGEVQGPSRAELADEVEWIVGRVGDGDCDGDGDEEISRRIAETIPSEYCMTRSKRLPRASILTIMRLPCRRHVPRPLTHTPDVMVLNSSRDTRTDTAGLAPSALQPLRVAQPSRPCADSHLARPRIAT